MMEMVSLSRDPMFASVHRWTSRNPFSSITFCIGLILGVAGCATLPSGQNRSAGASADVASQAVGPEAVLNAKDAPPGDLTDTGADLKAIPLAVNRQVLLWIDYFQGQGRPHMERYLSRSSRYMPMMKEILRKEGLPEDLIYIALIESGFSSSAHSTANAVGFWQFIRGTGRRYGMKIDSYVDERRDFVRSTQASAQYFKELYSIFRSWYLAIASYNVGENRVKNVILKYRTRDFWQLARENKLPEETTNYVPKFIAARLIAKDPEKYGFTDIEYLPALEFAEVEFKTSIDLKKLAKEMNLEYDDLRDLNPSYKRGVAFIKKNSLKIRVPKGTEGAALASSEKAAPDGNTRVYASDEDYSYYRVRRGDSISSIAKKFGTSQKNIRSLNSLSARTRLASGRRLRVPGEVVGGLARHNRRRGSQPEGRVGGRMDGSSGRPLGAPTLGIKGARADIATELQKARPDRSGRVHIVRKGDTLIEIARHYQIPLQRLASFNGLGHRAKVNVGTRIEIP